MFESGFHGTRGKYKAFPIILLMLVSFIALAVPDIAYGGPVITQKWVRSPYTGFSNADLFETWQTPLTADVNGDGVLDIIATGRGKNGEGYVYAISGVDGSNIWRVRGNDFHNSITIGSHSPFEVADLDGDGSPEIIVSAWLTLVLNSDGSLYWFSNPDKAYQNYNAVLDVTGSGYPEVFVSSGNGPNNGFDFITGFTYDGNVWGKAWTWHPCWGGNTVGDTNYDGIFELYASDRRVSYSGSGESYRGGAMGIKALDAETLLPLWNDPSILMSSHAAVLADVDKDGVLDVIVLDQSNSGIAVLNAHDGSVVTTGGIYRKGNTGMPAHSNPTVYDIDGDGNLEIISTREAGTPVYIWDLYEWKLDAIIPVYSIEPPVLADVTGDGMMNIIAVDDGSTSDTLYIYGYDSGTGEYVVLDYAPLNWGTAARALVADVDGDGLVEIVLVGMSGYVYCFDTNAPVLDPAPRSDKQFYSEQRLGAAEFVGPPTPAQPVLKRESPQNDSHGADLNPELRVNVVSYQKNPMDITFSSNATGAWTMIGTHTDVGDGWYTVTTTGMNAPGVIYHWKVTAVDKVTAETREASYHFTTKSNPPTHSDPLITGGDTQPIVASRQDTVDPDGDQVTSIYNWYVDNRSYTNLYLPFETRTTNNLRVYDTLFYDGFEGDLSKWGTSSNWVITTEDKHEGSSSLRAGSTSTYLTSQRIDASSAYGIVVSFWFKDIGVDENDYVWLQFWTGSNWVNVHNIGKTSQEGTWEYFTYQTYERRYLHDGFMVRIDGDSIDSGEWLYLDEFTVRCPTRAMDYSGYGNDAAVIGATWTEDGVVGGAYRFDGSNDWIRINDSPSLGPEVGGAEAWNAISLELWVKPEADHLGAYLVSKKDPARGSGSYTLGFSTASPANSLYWAVRVGSNWRQTPLNENTVLTSGVWHHVVATYNSTHGLMLYINGSLVSSYAATGKMWTGTVDSIQGAPLFIGYDGGSDYRNPRIRYFNGFLDEIRLYPRAVSPDQILQRYQETQSGQSDQATIVWAERIPGQSWTVEVTPNDSHGDGQPKQSHHSLRINIVGTGNTSPPEGTHFYIEETVVRVTAIPDPDTVFQRWILDGVTITGPLEIDVTMDGPHDLTAVFTTQTQTLNVTTDGLGTVSPEPGVYQYDRYTLVTVTATPGYGWALDRWEVDHVNVGSEPRVEVYMDVDHNVTAYFVELPRGNITIIKQADPKGSTAFNFSGELGAFTLVDDGVSPAEITFTDIVTDTWDIYEDAASAWTLQGIEITDPTGDSEARLDLRRARIRLAPGEHVTVVFINKYGVPAEILSTVPDDGAVNVSPLTDKLWFTIADAGGDLMNYSVTTLPDVGSAQALNQPDGTYSVNVTLQPNTPYQWTIEVWDGTNMTTKTCTFTTGEVITEVIMDNPDAVFVGSWSISTTHPGYYGLNYHAGSSGTGLKNGTYTLDVPHSGVWKVYAWWSSHTSRATNTPYTINHAEGSTTVRVNQMIDGGQWNSLGQYTFEQGPTTIVISDDADGWVIADAVRLFYIDPDNLPPVISEPSPPNEAINVPIVTTRLNFTIHDPNGDLMSYYVNMEPNAIVGSSVGSGYDGEYSVTVELDYYTVYTWTVTVNDGYESNMETYSFRTELSPGNHLPEVSDIYPADGATKVPITLTELRFTLIDLNEDPMEVAVSTLPSGIIVGDEPAYWPAGGNGEYAVPLSGNLDPDTLYTWYVNVHDGTGWINEEYTFRTEWSKDLTISVSGSGSTTPAAGVHTYEIGSVATVTATADPGWIHSNWILNGQYVSPINPIEVTMDADQSLTAVFIEDLAPVFEDGFESGDFTAWTGPTLTTGETATVVDTLSHTGTYSARFTTNGGATTEQAYVTTAIDLSEVYVRGHFYLGGGLPLSDDGDRFYQIRLGGSTSTANIAYAGIMRDEGVDKWVLFIRNGSTWSGYIYADSPLPVTGQWVCLELHWKLDSTAGFAELYVDDQLAVSVHGLNTASLGNAMRVDFGIVQATSIQNSLTVYGDNAAVSRAKIGPHVEPANQAPTISETVPEDGATGVSTGLTELSFSLHDIDDDLMNYYVTTVPDVGSGSGTGVANGVYGITVTGLTEATTYTWRVNVTDGTQWTNNTYTFTTKSNADPEVIWIKARDPAGYLDPGGEVQTGGSVQLQTRVSDLETPTTSLSVTISYRPQGGTWTSKTTFYNSIYNFWYYDWNIPGDAAPGLYDVKVDVEDLDGGLTTSTKLGVFTVVAG